MASCRFLPASGAPNTSESAFQWHTVQHVAVQRMEQREKQPLRFLQEPEAIISHTESLLIAYKTTSCNYSFLAFPLPPPQGLEYPGLYISFQSEGSINMNIFGFSAFWFNTLGLAES